MSKRTISVADVDRLARMRRGLLYSHGDVMEMYLDWARYELERGEAKLVQLEDLPSDAWVAIGSLLGSPLAMLESLPSGNELRLARAAIEGRLGIELSAILPLNTTTDTLLTLTALSAHEGIPLLDADTVGRGFAMVEQNMLALNGLSATPAALASPFGEVLLLDAPYGDSIARIGLPATVTMGGWGFVLSYVTQVRNISGVVARGTVTALISSAKWSPTPRSPFLAVDGKIVQVATAKVVGPDGQFSGPRLRISVGFAAAGSSAATHRIEGLNEFVRIVSKGVVLASHPDVILLLDEDNMEIPFDEIVDGLHAQLVAARAPEVWYSEAGLALANRMDLPGLSAPKRSFT